MQRVRDRYEGFRLIPGHRHTAAELRQIPPPDVVRHVDDVPFGGDAERSEGRVPDVAEGVSVKYSITVPINADLDPRRATGARPRREVVLEVDLVIERCDLDSWR